MLLQEYQTQWSRDFRIISHILTEALSGLDFTVEHVGSTAVPGMAAKPIIDIDVVYANDTDFPKIKTKLEQLGYYYNGNQGISGREVFKRHSGVIVHEILDSLSHHLYICPSHSKELRRHLLFRDYLRMSSADRAEYQALKYRIAEEALEDRKKYAELKEMQAKAFVEAVLAKAQKGEKA